MSCCGGGNKENDSLVGGNAVATDCDKLLKLLIIGDSNVGKSSLLLRFTENSFNDKFTSTVGVDFKIKTLLIDGKKIKLQIWDTAGQEKFRTITSSYYRGTHGVVVMFDLNNPETFEHVQTWISEIDSSCTSSIEKLLVGNKCDLPRQVSEESVNELVKREKLEYIATSAKDNTNVEAAFLKMAKNCLRENN
eukprot:TRINITY_DN1119_c0_g1_i1.p1 TRINITY_DN1119_c0_g1~~TRINITY_DN1119_c0_g1_i1.p1  ORF type:complete len:201 (-),score=40.50 TRINITY_DN1119_c0_g1_i1:110-685(-)